MSWCTQKKQKQTASELRIKTAGGKPAAPSAKLLSKFHRFFMDWWQQRLGRNQSKTVIFRAKLVPFMAGYVWFISLKNEWPKVGKKKTTTNTSCYLFFGVAFWKRGNTQICQGFFTLWLEDSKLAIRDHQIRIALKTSENVLRWWGWIIGKRQDPIRIINPNPGIQRKIDEFQTYSILPLSHIWSFTKKKKNDAKSIKKLFFQTLPDNFGWLFHVLQPGFAEKTCKIFIRVDKILSWIFPGEFHSGFRCRVKNGGFVSPVTSVTSLVSSHLWQIWTPRTLWIPSLRDLSAAVQLRHQARPCEHPDHFGRQELEAKGGERWYEVTRFPCHVQHVLCCCHVQFSVQVSFRRRRRRRRPPPPPPPHHHHHHHHLI